MCRIAGYYIEHSAACTGARSGCTFAWCEVKLESSLPDTNFPLLPCFFNPHILQDKFRSIIQHQIGHLKYYLHGKVCLSFRHVKKNVVQSFDVTKQRNHILTYFRSDKNASPALSQAVMFVNTPRKCLCFSFRHSLLWKIWNAHLLPLIQNLWIHKVILVTTSFHWSILVIFYVDKSYFGKCLMWTYRSKGKKCLKFYSSVIDLRTKPLNSKYRQRPC